MTLSYPFFFKLICLMCDDDILSKHDIISMAISICNLLYIISSVIEQFSVQDEPMICIVT